METQQFIINTLKPYFLDRGKCAIDKGHCLYRTPDGRKCAFGQHIRDEAYNINMEGESASLVLLRADGDILTKEASDQNLNGPQWDTIQAIHDTLAGVNFGGREIYDIIERCEEFCKVDLTELKELL